MPLEDGDLVVTETPREGWAVASGAGLDRRAGPRAHAGARRAGLVREVVRLVQEARKTAGLEVSDRIALWWTAEGALAEALTEHAEALAAEVLAVEVHPATAGDGPGTEGPEGSRFWVAPVAGR